ncbi:IS3 family transposase [Streptomyces sp. NPDC101194]|uniref:IS3 family transposase n=1 Tax=Streptomyces sp. NPDC101194 TaxID=3366127 RepID=UPI003828B6A2
MPTGRLPDFLELTADYRVHGVRKIWRELNRQGHVAARCTVARPMREMGIQGAVRGKRVITTLPGGQMERAPTVSTATLLPTPPTGAGSRASPT